MDVSLAEIAPYLRMGGKEPEGALAKRVLELKGEVAKAMRPRKTVKCVAAGEIPSPGKSLLAHLEGCEKAWLVCATLGSGVDSLQRRAAVNSAADALIIQAIGAAMIEKFMDAIEEEISASLAPGERLVTRYSPGYGDWPLEAQRELLSLLDAPRLAGVSLTSSLLMVPSKSVSAAIGVKGEK